MSQAMSQTSVLVANRGEIALRVMRTARAMGFRTVAVYSDADADAPHVRAADVAVRIGAAPAVESYLNRSAIVAAALDTGATLVHPGYGFLAEDDAFAADLEAAGVTFVGPPSAVLRAVGDKASARGLAEAAGVPVFSGYAGDDQSDDALGAAAARIGFPVLVKPAAGGGGKGMTVVRDDGELVQALASARRIASAAFGDDRLILERFIDGPRHVEVQVFGDTHGTVLHLGERDCSLQRRHQKICEESPAPNLDDGVRRALHDAAVAFASHANYIGAGTCESLVAPDGSFGFIEMNARLQVEHPVTEMVTGLDLVELQFRVALGEPLPLSQGDVRADGHAIEVRVYAEDPAMDFIPQAGRVELVRWPEGARVDAGVEAGTRVSTFYDPMLAKIIVHAGDREAALAKLRGALDETRILGFATNLPFLSAVVNDPVVDEGRVTTDWLEHAYADWLPVVPVDALDRALQIAAAAEVDRQTQPASRDPWAALGAWRTGGRRSTVTLHTDSTEHAVVVDGSPVRADDSAVFRDGTWFVWTSGLPFEFGVGPLPRRITAGPAHLGSPLPGRVVRVLVAAGETVDAGAELVVVEAMKMEHTIKAPVAAVVASVLCNEGDQVERGQPLVDLEPVTS